jgi:hypothetical protein
LVVIVNNNKKNNHYCRKYIFIQLKINNLSKKTKKLEKKIINNKKERDCGKKILSA